MVDPLAEFVTLLQPQAHIFKMVSGSGVWRIRRAEPGQPFYAVILTGACCLMVDGQASIRLQTGDFVLIPTACGFSVTSDGEATDETPDSLPAALSDGTFKIGDLSAPSDIQMLVGHSIFSSPHADLLVSLLPHLVHVRDQPRLTTLVELVGEESRTRRPARDIVLARLLEVLFIEALRSSEQLAASQGLLRGLADDHLAVAIHRLHEDPAYPWTVARLAKDAAMSRSAFFDRFKRAVGTAPMEYLLAWRMALAKKLLIEEACTLAVIAERVGYSSASAFSVAFTRFVGVSPTRYTLPATS